VTNINMIVAMDENRLIGKDGRIPWGVTSEMSNFKHLTKGGIVIMGRKTYESIGRALKGRRNIVLSKTVKELPKCEVFDNMTDALYSALVYEEDIFLIGGSDVYRQGLLFADTVYMSVIKGDFEGDTYFPEMNMSLVRSSTILLWYFLNKFSAIRI